MFTTLPTFFGPMVAIASDLRIAQEIRRRGHWEFRDTLEIVESFQDLYTDQPGFMLDIGCNIGSWTVPLAQRYPQNKIMAFDCQARMIQCLDQTIKLHGFDNVQTRYCAVSDHCTTQTKSEIDYTWGVNFGAYEFEPPYQNSDYNGKVSNVSCQVPVLTIDSLDLNRVIFMKLDIEGMEYKALQGSANTIQRDRPFIAFEHHKTNRVAAETLCKNFDYIILKTVGLMTLAVPS